jgi:hypothetical protein
MCLYPVTNEDRNAFGLLGLLATANAQHPPLSFVQQLETSLAGNIGIGVERQNATISGDDAYHANSGDTLVLPPMDPYGPKTRWIDVFARGLGGCSWAIIPAEPYVIANPSSGYTGGSGADTRVYISVDWANAPAAPNNTTVNIAINSSCLWGEEQAEFGIYPSPNVQVPIVSTAIPSTFEGFVESDQHIAIEAEHTSADTTVNGVSYTTIPSYGRTLSGVFMIPVLAPTQPAGTGPVLEYNVFTFTSTSVANVTLYISPSLNQNGNSRPLKYAIAFDDETPEVVQFVPFYVSPNYTPPNWDGAVSDGVWGTVNGGSTTTTTHDLTITGSHTLKIWAVEPGVVFQKIIIDLGGVVTSYLGPPESFRAGTDKVGTYDGTNFAGIDVSAFAEGI